MTDNPHIPSPLAEALNVDPASSLWRHDDLAAIWRHQSKSRIDSELAEWLPETLRSLRTASPALLNDTFATALSHPRTPPAVLSAVKELGKAISRDRSRGLPTDLGKLLYFLAIAASLVHGTGKISDLAPLDLRRGLDWAASLPWIDSDSLILLRRAREQIANQAHP